MSSARTITLFVALATLSSNVLSSVLFSQLPDDPFHLARNFGWYLHFANVWSVFGLVGAVREHALSIAIFANYLFLDTILCSIPRFLVLGLLRNSSSELCSPSSSFGTENKAPKPLTVITPRSSSSPDLPYPTGEWDSFSSNWSHDGCVRIITLAQWTLAAGLLAGTLLQFVGALYVREFAKGVWRKECRDEERFLRMLAGELAAEERRSLEVDVAEVAVKEGELINVDVEKMG